jgi:hypothetical protein
MVAIAVIACVYSGGLLIYFRNARMRRYDDWSKLYWRSDINDAGMVSRAEDAEGDFGECSDGGLISGVSPTGN